MSKTTVTLPTDKDNSARSLPSRDGQPALAQAGEKLGLLSLHANSNFRLLFSDHPHPMFVFDRETLEYLDVNDAAIKNYGYSRDEFLRMKISDIRPAEDVPRLMKVLGRHSLTISALGVWKHR